MVTELTRGVRRDPDLSRVGTASLNVTRRNWSAVTLEVQAFASCRPFSTVRESYKGSCVSFLRETVLPSETLVYVDVRYSLRV